jgi:hypothetical protein
MKNTTIDTTYGMHKANGIVNDDTTKVLYTESTVRDPLLQSTVSLNDCRLALLCGTSIATDCIRSQDQTRRHELEV